VGVYLKVPHDLLSGRLLIKGIKRSVRYFFLSLFGTMYGNIFSWKRESDLGQAYRHTRNITERKPVPSLYSNH